MTAAHLAQDLDTVDIRQPQIHQGQIGLDLIGQLESFLAGAGRVDLDVFLGEHARDERADVALVVDHED